MEVVSEQTVERRGKVVGEEALVFSRCKEATAAVPRVITHKCHVTCDLLGFVEGRCNFVGDYFFLRKNYMGQ